ncbi:mannitol dehydrogenase family protein [Protaetiibacter intestinalis]|uniref:Mannitol-1-phosphate 5-dehydrogenase n=1 Tax=Protaetiibacter intestinalis TaxID=2419774 RepID=A0A387B9G0_9MICO|nr:mannitol dehydrogenase family protein [Protaetiibacter intestinalis]AYF98398.1 mannitol dehydrogenase family protein [Protaetiibacter intestinalis]
MTAGTPVARLSRATLDGLPPGARTSGPRVDPDALTIGIVHFGLGAFHRAHQAVFTEDAAAAAGDTRWGILGVTGRSDTVVRQLQPQDGLYGVLTRDAHESSLRLVGSIRDVAWPGDRSGDVVETVAAATTHLATLTLTERGYPLTAEGRLDETAPGIPEDRVLVARELAGERSAEASHTPFGLLVRGLARRYRQGGAPFTVVSCDNLADNGAVARRVVAGFAATLEPGFGDWLTASVSFPSTMVDRITPATTPGDHAIAEGLLGLTDAGLVVAEPYGRWVLEDAFAGERPPWELAGAVLTDDVAPYETIKLRVLNTAHLLLAWTGRLRGHATIAEAVGDPELRELARRTIDDDILPTLVAPVGVDLAAYRDAVLDRFANPALAHTTAQVGSSGSQKLPIRVVGTVLDRLAAGAVPHGLAHLVAAWIALAARSTLPGGPALDDPGAGELRARIGGPDALRTDPASAVRRVLAWVAVFPPELAAHTGFRDAVVAELTGIEARLASASTTRSTA